MNKELKIVYVEDENDLREIFAETLSLFFPDVKSFENGQLALDYCLKNNFDVLITDLNMPVMNGVELIKNINAHKPEIKCIITTGNTNQYNDELNEITYLKKYGKPINMKDFFELLKSL